MKGLFYTTAFVFLFLTMDPAHLCAQARNTYIFIINDVDGKPVKGAKLITANTEAAFTDEYGGVKYTSTNGYVTITADGYKKMTKNVHGIKIGSEVIITLARLEPETKTLLVQVKSKKGKPIEGASVIVMPGTSSETDASGFAKTTHKQQPGDYITVIVNADGYKGQQKQVMSGHRTGKPMAVSVL